jgi:hypothetical protein
MKITVIGGSGFVRGIADAATERTLVPEASAVLAATRFRDWASDRWPARSRPRHWQEDLHGAMAASGIGRGGRRRRLRARRRARGARWRGRGRRAGRGAPRLLGRPRVRPV